MLTRFAPSPTGYLHLGHARSAFAVWHAAQAEGGAVSLRIEDIDPARCRPEFTAAIFEDLAWLGLTAAGPVRHQSHHVAEYARVIQTLEARGLIYRCFRSRAAQSLTDEEAAFVGAPLDPGEERDRLAAGERFAWRLSLAKARAELGARYDRLGFVRETAEGAHFIAAAPESFGDVILARKDAPVAYHLAVCHDDALQGITHVIRGEDLAGVTHVHVVLQALMDWPVPRYRFHCLLLREDGRKLSKSLGDRALRDYRADGVTADQIRRMTAPS